MTAKYRNHGGYAGIPGLPENANTCSLRYPREIVKAALRHNAAAVIFAHNHASRVAEPSGADEPLTRNLKNALALVDIKVLDNSIIAGSITLSFAEKGLI